MILIQQHFKNIKQILKTSRLNLVRRKLFRFIYNGRYKLVYIFFQTICIEITHLCVKCSKMMLVVPTSISFVLLTFVYHILLAVFVCIIHTRIEDLSHHLPLYVKRDKVEYIKEYVFLSINASFMFFSISYVYVVFLFSSSLSSEFVFLFVLVLYVCSLIFEIKKLGMAKKYITLRMFSNVPIFLVFQTAHVSDQDSVGLDFLLVYLNLWKVCLLLYEVKVGMYQDVANRIIKKYSALKASRRHE